LSRSQPPWPVFLLGVEQSTVTVNTPAFVQGAVQKYDAVKFIKSMQLRDPRVSPQFFPVSLTRLSRQSGHGALSRATMTLFAVDHLEVHTDGSAVLQNGWPAVPISAGWGAVFFAVRGDGSRRLLGALWGPVDVSDTSPYFLGARRPTIPVAELTAITVVVYAPASCSILGDFVLGYR